MAKRTKDTTTPAAGPSPASPAALHDPAQDAALAEGRHGRPFDYLGLHPLASGLHALRVFRPGAQAAELLPEGGDPVELTAAGNDVFFTAREDTPGAYRLRFGNGDATWEEDDPYRFAPVLGEMDEHFIGEGSHLGLWHALGAHPMNHEGVDGTHFAVWAPAAERVSVVGAFNDWDGRRHPMRLRGATGVWEIFLPGVGEGAPYKYEIRGADGKLQPLKADPVGFGSEHPPANASIVRDLRGYGWKDEGWLETRRAANRRDQPVSIYEVHLPSWRKAERAGGGSRPLSYKELADQLVPYVRDMGFTHIEMLPVSEYPFDGSWGYQPIGLYAPTIRHGTPNEFRDFVEACHGAGLGLILDWVPGHFPTDPHGLGHFDGTALYEYADPREGFHQDWNTLIYNYGRREVQNYLIANALYWLKEHHLDGLRVDAVASMLYRDYSRREGEWLPNVHGGRENLEAIAFLKRMNQVVYGADDGIMTVAEESTSFPAVSRPVHEGGLGFGYKWNMGWMNDTLEYMRHAPVHRRYHHHKMTFGLHYAFSENFILPLSHDEVVHGKGSLLNKMPSGPGGDDAEKFANLRAYLAFMWGHPGKKLLFMGQEFAQPDEWNHDRSLDWHLLEDGRHANLHEGMRKLLRDLNNLYRATPALHQLDCEGPGFQWIEANAAEESVFAWARFGEGDTKPVVVVCNFTPVERSAYRLGVPAPGRWIERVNTDAADYGGGGRGNLGGVESRPVGSQGRSDSIEITLPPLSTVVFELG